MKEKIRIEAHQIQKGDVIHLYNNRKGIVNYIKVIDFEIPKQYRPFHIYLDKPYPEDINDIQYSDVKMLNYMKKITVTRNKQ